MGSAWPGREGVSKFQVSFEQRDDCPSADAIREIESWRRILHRLQLIGQSADRYGGYGYGNISGRYRRDGIDGFVITGTQTGGHPALAAKHYALVTGWDPAANSVAAQGAVPPSSEALTHGQIYRLDPEVQCVVHGHCPEIWERSDELGLLTTVPEALYGTVAMATEVERLFYAAQAAGSRVLVMGGHRDGVLSYGASPRQATVALVETLALALAWRND